MHSLGNSSKWPSYDSLPSTSSFLHSESELTEDEADVFSSEGEGESGGSKSFSRERVPSLHFAFIGRQERFRTGSGRECCPRTASYPSLGASAATLGSGASTQGDLTFSLKCAELQQFVRPLLELLNGLKTGRFERGLSSFQQSVAMDRLQRIVGILQKPDMGEKYLRTLLQVEMMLKIWFPQVTKESLVPSTQKLKPSLPPRWHQNQLHIPVKKRKLSWSDADFPSTVPSPSPPPPHCKRLHRGPPQPEETYHAASTPEPASPESPLVYSIEQQGPAAGDVREESRGCWTWGHDDKTSDSKSSSSYTCSSRRGKGQHQASPLSSRCSPAVTQDSSVSSTFVVIATDSLRCPPLSGQQQQRLCCSPSKAEGGQAVTSEDSFPGQSPSLPALLRPSNREEEGTGSPLIQR